uniref:Acetyl-CoA carboxylase carboxyltransferase beta subunit n=1 Tax=Plantago maritima TaxID=197809 RepID=A0A0S1EIE5_9LAMI|nr:acetyl-CoA carboxylase carboxyltransferase beta subunit [Plantago maritima]ALJ78259.1 acetyl-CoA carboxylase carboxyltransferase beta subunit [Plantago maritima]QWL15783.1 acetyl-CoA carboxylase carboxyltransferase beta subunit [Plantago alpina]
MNSVERIEFVIDGNTWNPSDEDLVSEDQILVPASFTNSIDLPIDISEEAIIIMMEPGPPFDVTKGLVLPDRWRMTGVPKVFIGDDDEEEAEALPEGEGLGSGPPSSTNLGAGALDPDESDSNSFSSYFSIVILVITKELAEKSRMNTVPKVFIGDFDEAEAESLRGLGGGDQGGGPSISTNLGAGALDPDESDSNSSSSNEEESYEEPDESDSNSSSSNEEEFYEEESYEEHVDSYQTNTGLTEAVQTGLGRINDIPVAIAVMDFQFIGGSMGSLVGDKITRLIEYATNQSLPLIIVCASGGARMQEGSLSLIQMAKISSALYDFQSKEKLFYVPILTSPTTGGVTASFGMLGDIIIAEPNAYIAFAGKRVIEELLKVIVPEGSQETENLFEKGLFDLIVPRTLFKTVINELLQFHGFFPLKSN